MAEEVSDKNASSDLITAIIERFDREVSELRRCCNLMHFTTSTKDDELFYQGFILCDPLILADERSAVVIVRLMMSNSDDISLSRMIELVDDDSCRVELGSQLGILESEYKAVFERYAYIEHIHSDITKNNERYVEHYQIKHSCRGVPDRARFYQYMQRVLLLAEQVFKNLIPDALMPDPQAH